MDWTSRTRVAGAAGAAALLVAAFGGGVGAQSDAAVTLTYSVFNNEANIAIAQGLADTYMAQHPNVTIAIETRPTGSEGDNLVKTASRRATWQTCSPTTRARCCRP